MRTVEIDNTKYEYTYRAHDLFVIGKLCQAGDAPAAAEHCSKLVQHVEDNERNAMLLVKLGAAVLADISNVINEVERVKNSPAPSATVTSMT
jgi:hypothetical protein